MKITRIDPFTQKENTMELDITQAQLDRWQKGELIQNVFPYLTADEREFIKTGITPDSWDVYLNEESTEELELTEEDF